MFVPDAWDDVERVLLPLLDAEEARLLRPHARPAHLAVITEIDGLPWQGDPPAAADAAHGLLLSAVDPADDEGDVPWAHALTQLPTSPTVGSQLGRRWFTYLYSLRFDDRRVSEVQEAVAALSIAAHERLLGHQHEAVWWARTAALMTDYEDGRPMLGLVVFVRAARLLGPLVRAGPPRAGP